MLKSLRPALVLLLALAVITGIAYPLAITGVAQVLLPDAAAGSPVRRDGVVVGSALIGQNFTAPGYFHGRPSATPTPYDASNSMGSNLGPASKTLAERMTAEVARLHAENPDQPVPVDLVTTSGSSLDPHISPAAALFQVPRVARARGVTQAALKALVANHVETPLFGILGEARVNVLALNLDLDALSH